MSELAPKEVEQFEQLYASEPGLRGWVSAVNNQPMGKRFMVTALVFFVLGGIQALFIRAQLTVSENTFMGPEVYNQLFTMHGSTMMYLFAVPLLEGLAIYLIPLMIGARDVAFPRLSAFSYWTYLFGGILFYTSFFADVVPDAGWFAYTPLSGPRFSGIGVDFWLLGLSLVEVAGVTAGVEIVVTVLKFRAPGMSLSRMPLFVWTVLVAGLMIIFAFTTLLTATVMLELDRTAGTRFFDPENGGNSLLWQHLFWFFGHPEVYIMFLPATGIISMVVCAMARRPMIGYSLVVTAIVVIGFVSFGLWAHHMYTTGLPELAMTFFTAASLMIGIASGIQVFAWIATLWGTRPRINSTALFTAGFLFIFVLGGFTGVMVAVVSFDWQVHDTFFIVAHFHYVLIGGVVFPILAGLHHWYPKFSGRLLDERLGKWSFWLIFLGFNATFFPMHIMGFLGMPRRVYTYPASLGLDGYNILATAGAGVMTAGFVIFFANCAFSLRRGRPAASNPWRADSLEWSIPSPPPSYSFIRPPVARSRHPLWQEEPQESGDPWVERVREAMRCAPKGWRATLVTDAFDAKPEAVQPLPGPTTLPLAMALAVLLAFVGVLAKVYLVSAAGALVAAMYLVRWLWPDRALKKRILDSGLTEATDLPVLAKGARSTGWWAMICWLAVIGMVFAVLFYSYFYLQLFSEQWPQGGIPRPRVGLAAGATLLSVLAGASLWLGLRRFRHEESPAVFLAAGVGLGALSAAFYIAQLARLPFSLGDNAYGSVFWLVSLVQLVPLLLAMAFSAGVAFLGWRRWREEKIQLALPVDLTALLGYGLAGSAVAVFAVLYLSPYLIG